MKKARIALLVAAALCTYPVGALAQDDDEEEYEDDEEEEEEDDEEYEDDEEEDDEEEDDEEYEDEDEDDEEDDEEDEGELPEDDEGGLGGICEIDPEACPKLDFDKEAARDIQEEMYAVQQVFVLRVRRVELNPFWAITLNDQYVSHPGPGISLNYWITQVLAVGVNGTYYQPFNNESEFNFLVRRAARIAVPLTEYQWNANLNFTYVPIAGKFAGFGDFIFQYDAYLVGGVGGISTRPIPTIDPDNRFFDWEPKLAFNLGIGLRIFFNRWFAATMEVRDYIFNDKLENTEIAPTLEEQQNPDTWFGEDSLTNNVQAQVGLSIFIPFSFEYRLPK